MFNKFIATFVLGLVSFAASAVPVTMQFTASGFASVGAPDDPVSGTIVWDAPSATAPIVSLTSINLTIAGHAYTLGEVAFQSPFGVSQDIIYGSISGLTVSSGTNDFWVRWDPSTGVGVDFVYASSGVSNVVFSTTTFRSFSVTAGTAVPEPTSLLLVAIALAGLGFCRRKV